MSGGTITGHCVCGQYRITIPRNVNQMNLCHHFPELKTDCVDCRRWAGAMYSAHIIAPKSGSKIEGPEPRTYKVKGVKGMDMTRAWCDGCGSGLWIQPGEAGDQVFIKAGLFNPGDVPEPSMETFTKDMESWETVHKNAKGWEVNHGGL